VTIFVVGALPVTHPFQVESSRRASLTYPSEILAFHRRLINSGLVRAPSTRPARSGSILIFVWSPQHCGT
jgi:hypothetical protein